MCKATLWYVPLVILAVCFVMLAVQNAKALESDVERAQAAERVKAVLGLGLSGLVAAAAVFLPWAYRLPRELAQYERFKLVVKGCGIHRYAILFMSPFADGIIAAPFYSVFAILFGFIVAGVRKLLTWRVIRRLDERGIPFGLDS